MKTLPILLVLMMTSLSGCASAPNNDLNALLSIAAPEHYDVVVEKLELEASGVRHWRIPLGTVSCCWRGDSGPQGPGGSISPFPNYIAIQWFSMAEQKHYRRLFSLPEGLEEKMLKPAEYTTSLGSFERPRDILTVGLAPGGTIVIWIQNQIGNEIEVARMRANEIGGDPDEYQAATDVYLKKNGAYIDKHGVPTSGW